MKDDAVPRMRLIEFAQPARREVIIEPLGVYRTIGCHLYGEGLYARETKTGADIKASRMFLIEKGDLVVNRIWAQKGSAAIVPESLAGAVVTQDFPVWRLDASKAVPPYIGWYLKTPDFWEECRRHSHGTSGRERLNPRELPNVMFPLPPVHEQRRIVARIDEVAPLIQEAQELRAKAREHTGALLQSVLQEVFADLSERFGLVDINSFAQVKGGKRLPRGESLTNTRTPFPYIRVSDMKDHSVSLEELKYVPEHIHSRIARYTVSAEDVYLTIAGTIGYPGLIPDELDGANLTENAAKIVFRDGISVSKKFLVYALRSPQVQEQFQRRRTISAQPKLALRRIRSSRLPLAPLPVQHSIVAYLGALQAHMYELTALQVSTQGKLDALLPSVLDRAFKGDL